LKPDDIILKVNGEDIAGFSLDKVVPKILGPSGTTVKLTILNPKTGMSRDVDLVRARVIIHDVTWTRLPGTPVVHLRISAFGRGVGEDLRKALTEIKNDGAAAIILDLRNNPGGLLEQVVFATSEFVARGNVVLERNASGSTGAIPVRPGGMATEIRMATLINGGTASGAEIVAGALQDYNRAQLVGEKTFGTGTVVQ
jgi:carboxyl-terminal processing protease